MRDKNYKDNEMTKNTWQEISVVVYLGAEDCKRIWKNRRDKFTKEKRIWKSGDPQQEWVYYRKMSFYDRFSNPRKTVSATPKTDDRPISPLSTLSEPSLQFSSHSINGEEDSETDANNFPMFSGDSIDHIEKISKRARKNPK